MGIMISYVVLYCPLLTMLRKERSSLGSLEFFIRCSKQRQHTSDHPVSDAFALEGIF